MMQGWMKVKTAAEYADTSERLFRDWLKMGLRHVRLRGTIRVKPEWIDEFMQNHEVNPGLVADQVNEIVNSVCKDLGL